MKKSDFFVNSFLSCVLRNNKTFLPSGARTPIDYIVINFTYCVVLRGSPIEGQFLHLLLTMILIRIRKHFHSHFATFPNSVWSHFVLWEFVCYILQFSEKTKCLCICRECQICICSNKKIIRNLLFMVIACCLLIQAVVS